MHEDFHTILPFYTVVFPELPVPEVSETPDAIVPLYNGIDGIAPRRDGALTSTVDGASEILLAPAAVRGMGSDDVSSGMDDDVSSGMNAEATQQRAQRLTQGIRVGVYFALLCVVLGFYLRIN